MSCSGLNVISLKFGECSVNCVEPLFSADIYEKAGENPWASSMSFEMLTQVAGGPGWSSKVRVQVANGGSCLSVSPVPPTNPALLIQKGVSHRGASGFASSGWRGGPSLLQ